MDDPNLTLPRVTRYRRLPLGGYRSTALSTIIFILFIIRLAVYLNTVWSGGYSTPWQRGTLVSGVLSYGLMFILATLAFSLLATSEYMKQLAKLEQSQRQGWPHPQTARNAIHERLPEGERPKYASELVVIQELRRMQDGTPILEMIALSKYNRRYKVKVDRSGNVLEFSRLEE